MNINGIAKGSQLVVLKVLNAKGIGIEDKVIDGIKWIIDNYEKYNIKIVNISFGTIHNNCSEMRLIKYVEILWQLGLVVVAAAGNNGPDIGSITVPGVSKKIITVGVVEDGKKVNVNGRYTSNYSGRGPTCECIQKPDLIAYGNNIVSCNNNYKLKKYTVKSGTSMATPVVTGCVALLLSKYPELKNIDVKRKMIESCKDVNLPANIQGAGVINPVELLGVK
jgi:serine protease AprX